jgi:hypothetical protein
MTTESVLEKSDSSYANEPSTDESEESDVKICFIFFTIEKHLNNSNSFLIVNQYYINLEPLQI